MCLISIKTKKCKDKNFFLEAVKNGAESNPHGNGIILVDKDEIYWEKGLSKEQLLLRTEKNFNKFPIIITHSRLASAGAIKDEYTHPFLISKNRKHTLMSGVLKENEALLMHNGTFSYAYRSEESDTSMLAKELSKQAEFVANNPKFFVDVFERISSYNKIVIVSNNGIGVSSSFIQEKGCLFSNAGYNGRKLLSYIGTSKHSYSQYDYNDYDDYDVKRIAFTLRKKDGSYMKPNEIDLRDLIFVFPANGMLKFDIELLIDNPDLIDEAKLEVKLIKSMCPDFNDEELLNAIDGVAYEDTI